MMKSILVLALSLFSIASFAQGSGNTGGGSSCEIEIQNIRADLKAWILEGKHTALDLSSGRVKRPMSHDEYRERMLYSLDNVNVEVICPNPKNFAKIAKEKRIPSFAIPGSDQIGRDKVCVNYYDKVDRGFKIVCDFKKFYLDSTPLNQYQLVHHEFASLKSNRIQVELNSGANSDIDVSVQIKASLRKTVVYRLTSGIPLRLVTKVSGVSNSFTKHASNTLLMAWGTQDIKDLAKLQNKVKTTKEILALSHLRDALVEKGKEVFNVELRVARTFYENDHKLAANASAFDRLTFDRGRLAQDIDVFDADTKRKVMRLTIVKDFRATRTSMFGLITYERPKYLLTSSVFFKD